MSDYNYDSYCGLYCGACDILMAYKTGNKTNFSCFWTEPRLKAYQKSQGNTCSKSDLELKCHGCKSDTVFVNCRSCVIKNCAIEKNVEHCPQCKDYPCNFIADLKNGEKVLNHLKEKEDNLQKIKEIGVNNWLLEQEKRWKCPGCQTSFSWYSSVCSNCGEDLSKHAYKFNIINSLLFRLGIRFALKKKISEDVNDVGPY